MVERSGGRYLARTATVEKLEGERKLPQTFLIIEWPSKEAAMSFYQSEEYRPYLQRYPLFPIALYRRHIYLAQLSLA